MDTAPSIFTIIKVSRDKDLKEQIGRDIYFDIVDHNKICSFHVPKDTPFTSFKDDVAKEFCIPVQFFRFWSWGERQNGTYRPHQCLASQQEAKSVEELRLSLGESDHGKLNLFLEVELGLDLYPTLQPAKTKDDILVFFKLYDPVKEQLRYVGRLFVKKTSQPIEILGRLNQMAGFSHDEEIELYEELQFKPSVWCLRLDKMLSFVELEIQDGDIICFQKSLPLEIQKQFLYPDVPSFMQYIPNHLVHVLQGPADTPSFNYASTSSQSSSNFLEMSKNLLAELSSTNRTQRSTTCSENTASNLPPKPQSLQQQRKALQDYLALSLEAIEQANAFDEIERTALLLVQHSSNSLEKLILKDLVTRLETFKQIVPSTKSIIENAKAHRKSLSVKRTDIGAQLDRGQEQLSSLEAKYSALSEEELGIKVEILRLTTQEEELRIRKESVALELVTMNEKVSKDLGEWKDISKETEEADTHWLQAREKLAQANLSWKLFQQNLEQCQKAE